jgi:hypothetical protein
MIIVFDSLDRTSFFQIDYQFVAAMFQQQQLESFM